MESQKERDLLTERFQRMKEKEGLGTMKFFFGLRDNG